MKHIIPLAIIITIASTFVFFSKISLPNAHIMHQISLTELSPAQQVAHQRAIDAQAEMFQTLLTKLTAAIKEGGPTNAITVCSTEAATIAKQISSKYNLDIRRTSTKLRNTASTPNWWSKEALKTNPAQPLILTNELGALALINPITIAPTCLQCHGSTETDIAPQTKAALNALYPNDQATGYKQGDLRGWFTIYLAPS